MSLDALLIDTVRAVVREELRRVLEPPRAMTAAEVAGYLQLSVDQVRQLAAAGEIPSHRFGSQWRFDRAAIDALMSPRTADARSAA